MNEINVNIDYCGVVNLLHCLLRSGQCTEKEVRKIAARIAAKWGADIFFFS